VATRLLLDAQFVRKVHGHEGHRGQPSIGRAASYMGTLDALVIYENAGLPDLLRSSTPATHEQLRIVATEWPREPALLTSSSSLAAWVYLTTRDANLRSLPDYFEERWQS